MSIVFLRLEYNISLKIELILIISSIKQLKKRNASLRPHYMKRLLMHHHVNTEFMIKFQLMIYFNLNFNVFVNNFI
jgi:hypothetical protein